MSEAEEYKKEGEKALDRLEKLVKQDLGTYKEKSLTREQLFEKVIISCGVIIYELTSDSKRVMKILIDDCICKAKEE